MTNATGLPLTTGITGTLGVAHGGTGATTFTSGGPLLGNVTSPFTQGTVSGNTTAFLTADGSLTSGHCPQIDGSGGLIDLGAGCGGSTSAYWVNPVASYGASGLITNGQASCTSSTNSLGMTYPINGLANGMGIKVKGAGASGADLNTTITSGAGTFTLVLGTNCLTTVTSANVNSIGSIPSSSSTLTVASTTGWVTGEGIDVAGAGAAGADLITTVTVTSGTVLSLGANTSTGGPYNNVVINHDDTAALNAAFASGQNVRIPAGQFNVYATGANSTALTLSLPVTVQCAGVGIYSYYSGPNYGTWIWNRGTVYNTLAVTGGTGTSLYNCGIHQAVDITPTAGYGLVLGNGTLGRSGGSVVLLLWETRSGTPGVS